MNQNRLSSSMLCWEFCYFFITSSGVNLKFLCLSFLWTTGLSYAAAVANFTSTLLRSNVTVKPAFNRPTDIQQAKKNTSIRVSTQIEIKAYKCKIWHLWSLSHRTTLSFPVYKWCYYGTVYLSHARRHSKHYMCVFKNWKADLLVMSSMETTRIYT